MPIGAAAIAAGGMLIANQQNIGASAAANQNTQAFQEHMSGTAWQRAVADMSAAGLNPMLAYSQGPAQTPGYSAQYAPRANIGAAATEAYASASNASQAQAQAKNILQEMGSFEQRMKILGISTEKEHWATQAERFRAGIMNSEDLESARYYTARALELTKKATLAGLEIPKAVSEAAMWATTFGKALPYMREGADAVDKAVGAMRKGLGSGITLRKGR